MVTATEDLPPSVDWLTVKIWIAVMLATLVIWVAIFRLVQWLVGVPL